MGTSLTQRMEEEKSSRAGQTDGERGEVLRGSEELLFPGPVVRAVTVLGTKDRGYSLQGAGWPRTLSC